jgi:hypothetical protein
MPWRLPRRRFQPEGHFLQRPTEVSQHARAAVRTNDSSAGRGDGHDDSRNGRTGIDQAFAKQLECLFSGGFDDIGGVRHGRTIAEAKSAAENGSSPCPIPFEKVTNSAGERNCDDLNQSAVRSWLFALRSTAHCVRAVSPIDSRWHNKPERPANVCPPVCPPSSADVRGFSWGMVGKCVGPSTGCTMRAPSI